MSDSTLTDSWQSLVEHSSALRNAVEQQDWMRASEMAQQRHTSLLQHFRRFPVSPETAEFYQDHLARLLADEPELNALAVQARREVMKQGLAFNHNRRAVSAYQA